MKVGFDPKDYPGDGPYFALDKALAEEWQEVYENGLQEIHLARSVFEELQIRGLIKDDLHYPGRACYVLPDGLPAFNAAILQATPGVYSP